MRQDLTPGELIPDFLFDESGLALTFCYALHLVHTDQRRIRFEGEILSLRPKEVLIPLGNWDLRLGIPPEIFLGHLATLEALELVKVTRRERFVLVWFIALGHQLIVGANEGGVSGGEILFPPGDKFLEAPQELNKPNAHHRTQPSLNDKMKLIDMRVDVQNERPLTVEEAAEYLNISKSYLYRMTSKGDIAHFKPGGKKIYFIRADLNSWIRRRRVKGPEDLLREINEETSSRTDSSNRGNRTERSARRKIKAA